MHTAVQYDLFKTRVAVIVRDLWEGYKERHQAAMDLGHPWDDLAERQAAASVLAQFEPQDIRIGSARGRRRCAAASRC